MEIVFFGIFGGGLVVYVEVQSTLHLQHILFGDMLGIGANDFIEAVAISAFTVLFIAVKWRCKPKSPALMRVYLHYGLLCFLVLTIVAALKAVGIILSCPSRY